ncbi:MAG: hypothetical protein K9K64_07580 [Desulfohalobiaceae bacterium]|nr:hypothetical protein [Desulfohalobiaceae bacterium]
MTIEKQYLEYVLEKVGGNKKGGCHPGGRQKNTVPPPGRLNELSGFRSEL